MNIETLHHALEEARERFHIASYSVTLQKDGVFTSLSGGYRNIEAKEPADDDTLYAIGSCTKSFTAGVLCTLADEKKLSLDDRVRDYLPELTMFDEYVTEHLTIRDMLCHRSGLPRHELSWYSRLATMTEKDVIAGMRYLRPNQPLRYKWQYNNQMYAMSGYIIERITGKPWYEAVRERLLAPLGITRAAFSPAEAVALGGCAVPYLHDKATGVTRAIPHASIGPMSAAGSMYLTTAGLVKWVTALAAGGELNGKRILSKEMCKEMTYPQMIQSADITPPLEGFVTSTTYGLGLMNEVFRGRRLTHHGGHIDGFMADQSFLPDDGFSCAILTNLGMVRGAQVMRYIVAEHVLGGHADWSKAFDEAMGKTEQETSEGKDKLWAERPKDAPCPVALDTLCGVYEEPAYGDLILSLDGENLRLQMGELSMIARHYANQFFYLEIPEVLPGLMIEANVDINAKGEVIGFSAAFDVEGPEKIHFLPVSKEKKENGAS